MTPDPGHSDVSRLRAVEARAVGPGGWTRRLWAFGPYLAVFLVVFGGALFLLGGNTGKIVGACIVLPSGLGGVMLVVASSLGMAGKGWGSRTGR